MLTITRRKHNHKNMNQLKDKTLIKKERFNNRYIDIEGIEKQIYLYGQLTQDLFIQCEELKTNDYEYKHTNIYDLKSGYVMCISGIATLDIMEIPNTKESYKVNY